MTKPEVWLRGPAEGVRPGGSFSAGLSTRPAMPVGSPPPGRCSRVVGEGGEIVIPQTEGRSERGPGEGRGGAPQSDHRPSLILVREWDQNVASSRCCGRTDGEFLFGSGDPTFSERREQMEGAGVLCRAVQERFGDEVELRIVDPRNFVSLIPLFLRDFLRYRVPPRKALATLSGFTVNSVILNGCVRSRGEWPDAEWPTLHVAGAVRERQRGRTRG